MEIFHLKPSLIFFFLTALLHAFCMVVLFLVPLMLVWKTPFLLILIYSGYSCFCEVLQRRTKSVQRITVSGGGDWAVQLPSEKNITVSVGAHSVITRYFILLYLNPRGHGVSLKPLIIFPDSLSTERLRELRRCIFLA